MPLDHYVSNDSFLNNNHLHRLDNWNTAWNEVLNFKWKCLIKLGKIIMDQMHY